MSRSRPILIYDDACATCVRSVGWVRAADLFGVFRTAGYSRAQVEYPEVGALELDDGVIVRFADGSLRQGIDAVRSVWMRTPLAAIGLLLYLPGIHAAAGRLYAAFARRRSRACRIRP